MFFRLVYQSFFRQRRSKLLALIAVVLGVTVATAMIAVATDIGDKIGRELRSFGANIVVSPDTANLGVKEGGLNVQAAGGEYLNEADLPKIEGIFWRHNILGFAPFLRTEGLVAVNGRSVQVPFIGTYFSHTISYGNQKITTGVLKTHPWWRVQGSWPAESGDSVLVGEELAREIGVTPGTSITVSDAARTAAPKALPVSGIITTGGDEDRAVVAPLQLAQALNGTPGAVSTIYVSALTKPEDAFARRNPDSLSPADRDRWYCSPYANSIAYQLAEAIPHSRAEQLRRVAQSEGQVLSRIQGLMFLITLAALIAAGLAVSSAMATAVLQRRREIGLMKAIGASRASVAAIFYAEAATIALFGGLAGFAIGEWLGSTISHAIFGAGIRVQFELLPLVLLVALLVVLVASAALIQRAARFAPAVVLRGEG